MPGYKLTSNVDLIIRLDDGATIPRSHRWWREYEDWLAEGNTPLPADPPSPPPTNDEIYDQTIKNQRVLKALVLALNDGSVVPGANATGAQLKAAIRSKM